MSAKPSRLGALVERALPHRGDERRLLDRRAVVPRHPHERGEADRGRLGELAAVDVGDEARDGLEQPLEALAAILERCGVRAALLEREGDDLAGVPAGARHLAHEGGEGHGRDREDGRVEVARLALLLALRAEAPRELSLEAAAPNVAGAKRLADVAVEVLQASGSNGGAYRSRIATGGEASEQRQQFNVTAIAEVRAKAVSETLPPMKAIAASLFVLGAWTAAVFAVAYLRRRPHRRLPVPA